MLGALQYDTWFDAQRIWVEMDQGTGTLAIATHRMLFILRDYRKQISSKGTYKLELQVYISRVDPFSLLTGEQSIEDADMRW